MSLFVTELLLETATSADHVASADALVYCVGALKFLSGTGTVIKVLARRNCLHAMAVLLARINKTVSAAVIIVCMSVWLCTVVHS